MRQERLDKKKRLLRGASLTFVFAIVLVILWIMFFKNRTYIKQYEQERDTAFEATPFEKADDFLAVYNGDYDIILMDIEMPGTNGMDAAEQIRKKDAQVVIMFITNMAHYAIKGYEVGALDFVLKPIQYLNFANKMDRAMQLVENRGSRPVMIQTGTGVKKIDSRDIFYVEIQNHVLRYHTKQGILRCAEA